MSERTGARRRRRTQWQAMLRGLRYRLVIPVFRSPHSAEYTARGVANGVFWGLTPTVGLQTIEIVATWFVGAESARRADSSLLQALIWVWVNNPVTMIPMYYTFYVTGLWLLGRTRRARRAMRASSSVWTAAAALGWSSRFRDDSPGRRRAALPRLRSRTPSSAALLSYRWALRLRPPAAAAAPRRDGSGDDARLKHFAAAASPIPRHVDRLRHPIRTSSARAKPDLHHRPRCSRWRRDRGDARRSSAWPTRCCLRPRIGVADPGNAGGHRAQHETRRRPRQFRLSAVRARCASGRRSCRDRRASSSGRK